VNLDVATLPPLSAAMGVDAFRTRHRSDDQHRAPLPGHDLPGGLESRDGQLHLTVADNGKGLDPAGSNGGNGLHTMREQAEELRGRLSISSPPGTTVIAELPIGGT
jgi:two-component sensor histidine kinase